MDGLFQEKSHLEMDDDWGYPYDSGNHHEIPRLCATDFFASAGRKSCDRSIQATTGYPFVRGDGCRQPSRWWDADTPVISWDIPKIGWRLKYWDILRCNVGFSQFHLQHFLKVISIFGWDFNHPQKNGRFMAGHATLVRDTTKSTT